MWAVALRHERQPDLESAIRSKPNALIARWPVVASPRKGEIIVTFRSTSSAPTGLHCLRKEYIDGCMRPTVNQLYLWKYILTSPPPWPWAAKKNSCMFDRLRCSKIKALNAHFRSDIKGGGDLACTSVRLTEWTGNKGNDADKSQPYQNVGFNSSKYNLSAAPTIVIAGSSTLPTRQLSRLRWIAPYSSSVFAFTADVSWPKCPGLPQS